jgi:hypothetical protein
MWFVILAEGLDVFVLRSVAPGRIQLLILFRRTFVREMDVRGLNQERL